MKDKLNKTHHKRLFYASRRLCLLTLIAFGGVATFAVPTYISLRNTEIERLKAEEKEEEEDNSSSSEETTLSYYD